MASLGASGVWELFIPLLAAGSLYKFEIRNRQSGDVFVKIDPCGREFELRPSTAARVSRTSTHRVGRRELAGVPRTAGLAARADVDL